MLINIGEKIPEIELNVMTSDGPTRLSTLELCEGKKVVLFGVPGAFTPTCSAKHLPGFIKYADTLKKNGADSIACLSVNDVFVMGAWGIDQNAGNDVLMIADGSAKFSKATGLDVDLTERDMGIRCKRFLMIIDNKEIILLKVDKPGKFEVTGAEDLLSTKF